MLLAYSDDIYCAALPVLAAGAISAAPQLYEKIGLQIGWGRDKTELALPPGVRHQELHLPRDDQGSPLPHLVDGFDACLGIPRHRSNSQEFIQRALGKVERKHDGLLQLVEEVAEFDPMAALNLLRASSVNRFGHIMSAVPPLVCAEFCQGRDEAVLATFTEIQRFAPDPLTSTHHFPINLGGAGLDSLVKHARGNYIGTFFRVAGPLYERLLRMGFGINLVLASHLAQPHVAQATYQWAWHLAVSFGEAKVLEGSFTQSEHDLANLLLPRGNIITEAGDFDSVNQDLPDTIDCEVLPPLEQAVAKPRGYKHVAAGHRRLTEWRSFLDIYHTSSPAEQTKMLTHSGHGSVTALKPNITQTKDVSPQCARVMIRRITGSAALGKDQLDVGGAACPQCDHPAGSPESLERHSVR